MCPLLIIWWSTSSLFLKALSATYWTLGQLIDSQIFRTLLIVIYLCCPQTKRRWLVFNSSSGYSRNTILLSCARGAQITTVDNIYAFPLTEETILSTEADGTQFSIPKTDSLPLIIGPSTTHTHFLQGKVIGNV